jgi:hypothetical protein
VAPGETLVGRHVRVALTGSLGVGSGTVGEGSEKGSSADAVARVRSGTMTALCVFSAGDVVASSPQSEYAPISEVRIHGTWRSR